MGETPILSRREFLLVAAGLGSLALVAGCSSEPSVSRIKTRNSTAALLDIIPDNYDPQLNLLKQYENETGVAPIYIDFIGFPQNQADALISAAAMAGELQTWHKSGTQPLIILEPTFNGGQDMMDLTAFNHGEYDDAVDTLFATLAELGVTDEEMGTWVPFPEPNIPGWSDNNTDPSLFTQNVTKVAAVIKHRFPKTQVSIMLNSQTSHKPNWSDAAMNPRLLVPYDNRFRGGLIDSFGLQGFTWNNEDNPATFLSAPAAMLGAEQLGSKHIWFITGTFSELNDPNGSGIIKSDNQRRAAVLNGVLNQALAIQAAGYTVDYINIFGEDKLVYGSAGAGTANYRYDTPEALAVLREFVSTAKQHNIPVAIFDDANDL